MDHKTLDYISQRIESGATDEAVEKFVVSYLKGVVEIPQNEKIEKYEKFKSTKAAILAKEPGDRSEDEENELSSINTIIDSMEAIDNWLVSPGYSNRPVAEITEEAKAEVLAKFYSQRRKSKYPPIEEYLDAKVKQASSDPGVQSEGITQEAQYYVDCLAVKASIPKPV